MKAKIVSILSAIKQTLGTLLQHVQANTLLKQQELEQKENDIQQQLFFSRCNQHLSSIPDELFYVMANRHYPYIQMITIPSDIVPVSYKTTPNGVLYYYNVIATQQPANCQLMQLKQKINHDIYTAQQQLLFQMPYQNACMLYTHIVQGLYIMDITPNGMFFKITVASNFF